MIKPTLLLLAGCSFLAAVSPFSCPAAPLILNEYNAVSSSKYLGGSSYDSSSDRDSFFGRVQGNGGNWFELAVTQDHLDVSGWQLQWSYWQDAANNGTGTLTLSGDPVWKDLRSGTILTFIEKDTAHGGLDTDLGFDPSANDWWINICAVNSNLVTTAGFVTNHGVASPLKPGEFKVNNNNWALTIKDASGTIVFGPAGEGATNWTFGGVSSTEIAQLRVEPSPLVTAVSSYGNGTLSTFGAPNTWNGGALTQDFSLLRAGIGISFHLFNPVPLADGSGWHLRWTGSAGNTYLLQRWQPTNQGPNWGDIIHVKALDSVAETDDFSPRFSGNNIYRVVVPDPLPADLIATPSVTNGEYSAPVPVSVLGIGPSNAVIPYTTDGSEPTLRSPILASSLLLTQSASFRTAWFEPGKAPGTVNSSFFVVNDHFDLPVAALLTDPANLFDANSGIYMHPDSTGVNWERPAGLVYTSPDGTNSFSASVGVRIAGGYSREQDKKSFRAYWRNSYGPGSIARPLFRSKPDQTNFTELILRGGGTDQYVPTWSLVRDPLVQQLYSQIGGLYSAFEFTHLFVNNDYWGIYTWREQIDSDYLARNLGISDADMIKLEEEVVNLWAGDLIAWNAMTNFFQTNSFASDSGFALATNYWDLDNFTDYQILEIFAGNMDWPHNNIYAFRDRKTNSPWRYVLWDTDLTFGLPWWFDQAAHDTLTWASRGEPRIDLAPPWLSDPNGREATGTLLWSTIFLRRLLENPNYQVRFINRFADLLNTTLLPENIETQLDDIASRIRPEIQREIQRWQTNGPATQWDTNVAIIRKFAETRPDRIRAFIAQKFGLSGTANLSIAIGTGNGQVKVNSITPAQMPWQGRYFMGVPVTLTAIPAPGYAFSGWDDPSLPQSTNCTVTLTSDKTVTANFTPLSQ